MHHEQVEKAEPGDNVGFNVKIKANEIKRGYVAGNSQQDPPKVAENFVAQIIVINHPSTIKKGYTPVVDCHTSHIACKFEEITAKVDRRTGVPTENNPEGLRNGDSGLVVLRPQKEMCCEVFSEYPPLGRFAVRDLRQTVAVGIIKEVKKKD